MASYDATDSEYHLREENQTGDLSHGTGRGRTRAKRKDKMWRRIFRGKKGDKPCWEGTGDYGEETPARGMSPHEKGEIPVVDAAASGKGKAQSFGANRKAKEEAQANEPPRSKSKQTPALEDTQSKSGKIAAQEAKPSTSGRDIPDASRLNEEAGELGRENEALADLARELAKSRSEREMEEAAQALAEKLRLAELNLERIKTQTAGSEETRTGVEKRRADRGITKRSGEEEEKDSFQAKHEFIIKAEDLDAYLGRFERMTQVEEREQTMLARRFSASLRAKALDVYSALQDEDATDDAHHKDSHVHRFRMAAEAHRQKTRSVRRLGELAQLVARVRSYAQSWKNLAKEAKTSQALADLLGREQFLQSVKPELAVFMRERVAAGTVEDPDQTN